MDDLNNVIDKYVDSDEFKKKFFNKRPIKKIEIKKA